MVAIKKKILLVEDEDELRGLMAKQLVGAGYEVFQAQNGKQGLEFAEEKKPDLIISDVLMPEMDGNTFLLKLREASFGQNVPFMVLTAKKRMEDYFYAAGAIDFVAKPFPPELFLSKVKSVFEQIELNAKKHPAKKILVAGSSPADVESMVTQLRAVGCHVDSAMTGEDIIPKFVQFLPDVLIIDTHLAGMPADKVIRVCRYMPEFRKIPILLYYRSQAQSGTEDGKGGTKELSPAAVADHCLAEGATEDIGELDPNTFIAKVKKFIRKRTVVIIDDDSGTVQMVKNMLKENDYNVFAASNGRIGLELIRKEMPHVILLDIMMPEMNGYEIFDALREDPLTKEIPVIMLTVKGEQSEIQAGLDLGSDDYIVKPFHLGLLLKRIETLLKDEA